MILYLLRRGFTLYRSKKEVKLFYHCFNYLIKEKIKIIHH
ncbi:hypothetical protein M595_0050 [Lyngbya aestuarii BL J]|uniref:Uncharacterized protein n=1 Tax=Lyngbya aestuarii BL J TaxID=1348334 RepID=U7QP58_9CYAN|nr:hypothetical protein M595_0050 [Lyngbya aestuarii BL J]